ncbi:interferon-alpha/beta-receptor-like secreted glycoprotein [Cotia virus SPAn232]|uniref:Interferon-alpha/beta-receptor-like secreted glycoprotein n=2 Tax=Cotia virus TaxID=39444 RepID=H6TAE5_9POXV|nr:interferon-alpha/beta-receptor-like secreted glycoprotein [Cotia virus SPAn232]YP_005296365.1 interferon-alpha/beta-receptor-like secreted glycoprotein [Cotia virus SPAn232]AIT70624.1 interferon-alpha/beta-receptor-like secreted glycoprotein [Cotia virus]AFB76899.1 interferon-alpha/beta-receptor-like secreted glycoprotein [Cotia virus SPAn232]AFB76979.1 interferon-alpha/beta-receptor-like secreted glycoprotein [Cotia virus SPAn232]AIT70792.1 interferon-alpha/beta-receptor-like secreted glyc
MLRKWTVFYMVFLFIIIVLGDSLDNFFMGRLKELPQEDFDILDPKCKYGGIISRLARYNEPFSTVCGVVYDASLYYKYKLGRKNYTVEWSNFDSDRGAPLNADVVGNSIVIQNYTSEYNSRRYICKVTIPENNNTCIETIMKTNALDPVDYCLDEDFELGQNYEKYGVDLFCDCFHFSIYDKIVWFKDNKEIEIDNKKYSTRNMILNIKNITYKDAGEYICKVQYNNKFVFNRCKNLHVSPKKYHGFTMFAPDTLSVKIGEPANVTCKSIPSTKECIIMYWENEKEYFIGFDLGVFTVSSDDCNSIVLYFENITREDIGSIYTCHGGNSYMDKSVTTKLVLEN